MQVSGINCNLLVSTSTLAIQYSSWLNGTVPLYTNELVIQSCIPSWFIGKKTRKDDAHSPRPWAYN